MASAIERLPLDIWQVILAEYQPRLANRAKEFTSMCLASKAFYELLIAQVYHTVTSKQLTSPAFDVAMGQFVQHLEWTICLRCLRNGTDPGLYSAEEYVSELQTVIKALRYCPNFSRLDIRPDMIKSRSALHPILTSDLRSSQESDHLRLPEVALPSLRFVHYYELKTRNVPLPPHFTALNSILTNGAVHRLSFEGRTLPRILLAPSNTWSSIRILEISNQTSQRTMAALLDHCTSLQQFCLYMVSTTIGWDWFGPPEQNADQSYLDLLSQHPSLSACTAVTVKNLNFEDQRRLTLAPLPNCTHLKLTIRGPIDCRGNDFCGEFRSLVNSGRPWPSLQHLRLDFRNPILASLASNLQPSDLLQTFCETNTFPKLQTLSVRLYLGDSAAVAKYCGIDDHAGLAKEVEPVLLADFVNFVDAAPTHLDIKFCYYNLYFFSTAAYRITFRRTPGKGIVSRSELFGARS